MTIEKALLGLFAGVLSFRDGETKGIVYVVRRNLHSLSSGVKPVEEIVPL
jgi:hypothetical protein